MTLLPFDNETSTTRTATLPNGNAPAPSEPRASDTRVSSVSASAAPDRAAGLEPVRPIEELQRFARQIVRMKPIFELIFYLGSLAVGVASIAAACIGWWAFREYQVQNRVAARAQLVATEQSLAEREIEDGLYSQLHADVPAGTAPEAYASQHLALLTADPKLRAVPNAAKLHELIWSTGSWEAKNRAELQGLRKLHRHAETYLYHLQTAFDYRGDSIITDGEWETWAGMITDIGPHPVLLAALHHTHRHLYLSRDFATDLRRRLTTTPAQRAVVERFYPEMLSAEWLQGFPSYSYGG